MENAILDSMNYSGGTDTLTVEQSHKLAEAVVQAAKASKDATVTLLMKGISSMSTDASVALFGPIVSDKDLARKVAIRGISPYMHEVMYIGMRGGRSNVTN